MIHCFLLNGGGLIVPSPAQSGSPPPPHGRGLAPPLSGGGPWPSPPPLEGNPMVGISISHPSSLPLDTRGGDGPPTPFGGGGPVGGHHYVSSPSKGGDDGGLGNGGGFPRKNGDLKKKFSHETGSLSKKVHGCRILPELLNITCASQERATPRCDFSRIAAGQTIFLYFQCSHETTRSVLDNLIDTGLARSWDTILTFSTRCFTQTRRNYDPATCRRRHRRPTNHYGHKTKQTGV